MKREYRKPGKAGGSAALPGKKTQLLAMALLLAVLAGSGFAIREEKDISGQTRQQDADPDVIELDGPIQPSAIITKDGVVIPKYNNLPSGPKSKWRTPGAPKKIAPPVVQEVPRQLPDASSKNKMRERPSVHELFADRIKLGESLKLEDEYKYVIKDGRNMKEEWRSGGNLSDWAGTAQIGMFRDVGPVNLKWKYMGKRVLDTGVEDGGIRKSMHVWQTAIVSPEAKGIEANLKMLKSDPGVHTFFAYIYGKKIDRLNRPSFIMFEREGHEIWAGPYDGDTVYIDFWADDTESNPNNIKYFEIIKVNHRFTGLSWEYYPGGSEMKPDAWARL